MVSKEDVYIAYGTVFQGTSRAIDKLSWFTEAICDEILAPNIDVDMLFTRVRQNIFTKHFIQLPVSVNGLLDKVILHTECDFDETDKRIYDFVEKYGDDYNDRYGYFRGENLIFIDAAQYHDIGLLDTYWKYTKVQNKLAEEMGIKMPILSEEEHKIVYFLGSIKSPKHFSYDISHTWYYNGRQIRMGEIPPLPPSMQRKLPEKDKELLINVQAQKLEGEVRIGINLPDNSEIFIKDNLTKCSRKYKVLNEEIVLNEASDITQISIQSGVFSDEKKVKDIIGDKGRNLAGEYVEYSPLAVNQINFTIEF